MPQSGTLNLPPGITGQQRGELQCRLGPFKLRARRQGDTDQPLLAHFTFWGHKGPDYALKVDQASSSSTARFPISCGPKGFTRYLQDMQSLVIHVEDAYSHFPLGKAVVDVSLLSETQPITGTFPLLISRDRQGVLQAGGATYDGVAAAAGSLGSDLHHVGSFDLHLELGFFSTVSLRSFEMNERLAKQVQPGIISHPPISFPSKSREESSDHPAVGSFDWDTNQLDLFELLLNRLLIDFKTFCEVFDAWKSSPPLRIVDLFSRMKSHRVFEHDIKREQMQYLEVMIDPKGTMDVMSIDDFVLSVRQSVEAGVRVKSRLEMQPVLMMLAPLAQNIQQALTLLRQAFRDSSFEGESGLMTMSMLSSVLQELLPPFKTQQLRYLMCILAHQGSSGRPGIISFQDIQAFLRMAASSVSKGMENTADAMADSDSPADMATNILSGIPSNAKAAKTMGEGRFGKDSNGSDAQTRPQIVKRVALDRLKDRLKDQRPLLSQANGFELESEPGALTRPLLQPFPPPLPVFLEINPPLPTQPTIKPVEPVRKEADEATSKVSSDALDLLIKKAEALQSALAEASLSTHTQRRLNMLDDEDEMNHISMLQYVSDPTIALDFAQAAIMQPSAAEWKERARRRVVEGEGQEESGSWNEQDLLHHLFFPASVDASLDLTPPNQVGRSDEDGPLPDEVRTEDPAQVDASADQATVKGNEVADALDGKLHEQGNAKPGLHLVIHDACLPAWFESIASARHDLSLVVRSSCLMTPAQGIHWPISRRLDGERRLPLLSLNLPIQDRSSLPCLVIVELWSDKRTLIGVSQVHLTVNEQGNKSHAISFGDYPMTNPLLSTDDEETLSRSSHFKIEASLALHSPDAERPQALVPRSIRSIQHNFRWEKLTCFDLITHFLDMFIPSFVLRVTVCQAIDAGPKTSLPLTRFVSYLYPGDSEPLCTEEVPGRDPMFAASVAHSLTLPRGEDLASRLIEVAREALVSQQEVDGRGMLQFGLWERWTDDEEPVLSASTSLPLSSLAELAFASKSISDACLSASIGTFVALPCNDDAKGGSLLLIQLQYDLAPSEELPEGNIEDPTTSQVMHVDTSPQKQVPPSTPVPPRYIALLTVDIIQATGLTAAVLEAQSWLGSSAALLGRSHLTGPSPYVSLELISGGSLKGRFPKLQTPFLIHSSCPRFNHQSQLELTLDSALLEALATQHLCIEVWHHTSRALAAESTETEQSKVQDILLGCTTCPLSSILLKPTGIHSWLVIKSQRGEPVGAVQMAVSLEALKRFTCEEGGSEIEVILPFDACPDSAPPLLQHPEILAGPMLPPTAREHLMGLAPWAFTHASKNHAAPPPEQPTDGIWPSPTTDHLSTSLPHGFGGQWCRLTLHVDQLVLPSPGAAAEFRPKSYKYYASYKLPGAYNVDIDTAAQTAKAQQVSSSTSPSSSPTTSWVVPLSHCGIHWVRADSALAAALARSPLLLRVFRVYGKTTGLLAAKPHQASGDDHTETWLSCTQVGECTVDLSSMISSSAIRKHQPNTRWLSGTFSLIEPESKVFANNRIQVRSLLELLPSTLPPLSWLSKSAWQPIMAPNPAPLLAENVYPDASLSENKASNPEPSLENTARDEIEGNVEANVMAEERVHVDAIEPLTAEASAEIVAPPSPSVELQPPSPIDQASVKIQPPSPIDQATFLNDYLFSFSRGVNEEVPEEVADAMLSPLDPEPEQVACEDFEAGGVEIVQALSSDADVALAVQSSADHRSMSSDVPDMASDKATLRRQLQELELMSMGFRTRFGSLDGQESPTSSPQIQDQQAVVIVTEEEVVSLPAPLLAPRVERTCSEDGANLLNPMFGYASGSDSDDTDELIARASGARASGAKTGIKMDPTVNAPTLFSSALDPDLIFSFTRPNRPVTASSSQSALSTHPAPQFMAWGIGQLTANSSPATEEKPQDDFYFSSDPAPSRVSYEAPSKPARFTFSNALPGLLPDFKLDFSG